MITRIELTTKITDTRAQVRKKKIENIGFSGKIKALSLFDVYTVDKKLTSAQLEKISSALANPVTQIASINSDYVQNPPRPLLVRREDQGNNESIFDFAIEIGFLPGVTDNVANTAKEIISDLLQVQFERDENVYTSQVTFITGKLTKEEIKQIALSLYNPVIQRAGIKTFAQYKNEYGMDKDIPNVKLDDTVKVETVDLDVSDEELAVIGKQGIPNKDGTRRGPLALDLTYMKAIQAYFKRKGRKPTDIELESIAQTWSEHCKHTIFADPLHDIPEGLFKKYIKRTTDLIRQEKGKKDNCVSVFKDNSGAIEFDENFLITHKVETHNSPSALDPFGGAVTGIVGVNRDAIGFGLGAKPVINMFGFCLADPNDKKPLFKGSGKTEKMLTPRRILDGVIDGVNFGGNCSGIPTPQGFVYFDERYKGKPLIFVGTVGLIPKKVNGKPSYIKKAKVGDYIVVAGGRVGLDGIHGATFSSEALDSGSPATAVQIGDPITQKKLSDAIVKEARDMGLFNSITDNGAGGLSCSVAEMATESGGFKVFLENIPLKYSGLHPWQIWISESQERMTLAVSKRKWKTFKELMDRRGVEAKIIGEFTNSGKGEIFINNKIIFDIDLKFLHEGLPQRVLEPGHLRITYKDPRIPKRANINLLYKKMLKGLNISSYEFISAQYDHEVQGGSVIKPLQGRGRVNGETTVTRPLLNSNKGVVLSQGIYPLYSDINTYDMAACTIDTAIRNIVVAGVNPDKIALLDNFCWCSSTESNRLGQLRRAARACHEVALEYGTPFISGKDSMFNDFKGYDQTGKPVKISIPPTLLISSIGVLDNVIKTVSIDLKFPGDLIYVLGETHSEMGGSEFYMMMSKNYQKIGHRLPKVNVFKNKRLYGAYLSCLNKGIFSSSISITRGGLGVALAKSAIAGLFGINISLKNLEGESYREDFALFSETQGRILVSINPKSKKQFESFFADNSFSYLGTVSDSKEFVIHGFKDQIIVDIPVDDLLKSYKSRFAGY